MKIRNKILITIILIFVLGVAQLAMPAPAYADATVGNGTPGSCTESAFNTALAGGGLVTFNCGSSPHTITLTGTKTISSNTQINGGGLITISGADSVRVFTVNTGVTFALTSIKVADGNNAGNGGGMYVNSGATANVTNSTFEGNNAVGGYGGAIYVNAATLNVTDSTFTDNSADVSTLGNLALGGGAIQNNDGTVTISSSTFSGNSVISHTADGGAVYNGDLDNDGADTMTISNSTFFNNMLENDTDGSSGGAVRSNGNITLTHNTFSDNDSGVSQLSGGESGAVTLANGTAIIAYNIFANSTSYIPNPLPAYDCAMRNAVTSLTSVGNLAELNFSCAPVYTSDPVLGSLQNNGGPTQTMALGVGSPAINNAGTCAAGVTKDQRGVARPQPGGNCDIGAYELDTTAPTVTIEKAGGQADPTNATPVNYTVTFSEPVVGFATGDVNLSASTVGGSLTATVTGGPTSFNVAVTGMTTPGNIIAVLNAGVATDIALNSSAASTSSDNTVAFDATGPTVTLAKAIGQADPTDVSPINFSVQFSESVTGFNEADVSLGGTANPTTKVVTGSGAVYNIAVSGMSNDGTVTASVSAGAATDALGNPSSASTSSDNTVAYDTTIPEVESVERVGTNPTGASSVNFTVTFSESVTGVNQTAPFADFELFTTGISGASITSVSGAGSTYTVSVNTGSGNGTIRLDVADDNSIADIIGNPLGGVGVGDGDFTSGEEYTILRMADIDLTIGSNTTNHDLAASQSKRVSFPSLNNGPVQVENLNTLPLIASQQVLYGGVSYSEMMGLPFEQLSQEYWFPYYNNVAMSSQLRVSNLGAGDTTITIYLAGDEIDSFTLAGGAAERKNYANANNGPLQVTSSATDILATVRVLYGGMSYSELVGLPVEQLSKEYWYPIYDNSTANSQLRVSNLGVSPTTINVYLADKPAPIDSYILQAGEASRKSYPYNTGPLRVVSSEEPILSTIRLLYKNRSFAELMGVPVEQLSRESWYPVYDNLHVNSQLRVSNAGDGPTTVTVYAGGRPVESFGLPAGQSIRKTYAGMIGPLGVISNQEPIVSSIRMLYTTASFSSLYELMGMPGGGVTTQYFFPWYNNVAMNSELRFAIP